MKPTTLLTLLPTLISWQLAATPLTDAAEKGLLSDVQKHLGRDINKPNKAGETALHIATKKGYFGIVRILINAHADINKQNAKGQTALMIAAENGNDIMVEELLKSGADITIQNKKDKNKTALDYAKDVEIQTRLKAASNPTLPTQPAKELM